MKSQTIKTILLIISMLGGLAACSGGGVDSAADKTQIAAPNAEQRIADWGKFVGVSAETARDELGRAGLLNKVGKDLPLTEGELQAFTELHHDLDGNFRAGIQELNDLNGRAAAGISQLGRRRYRADGPSYGRGRGGSPGYDWGVSPDAGQGFSPGGREEIRRQANSDYQNFAAQANLVRNRLVLSAELLAFRVTPISSRDLLTDTNFKSIRDAYAAPLLAPLLQVAPEQATEQEIQSLAAPLAAVSFEIGGEYLSFYDFNALPSGATDEANTNPGWRNPGPRVIGSRGGLAILLAAANSYSSTGFATAAVPFAGLDSEEEVISPEQATQP